MMSAEFSYRQELLRKSIHLSSLWMPVVILFLPFKASALIFATLLFLNVVLEYGYYRQNPMAVKIYGTLFSKTLRVKETGGRFRFSGGPYVIAAALLVTIIFSKEIAAVSLTVMLIADTAAALIGRPFGKHKINNGTKSIEGTLAFLIAGGGVLFFASFFFSYDSSFSLKALIGLLLATIAEVYENRLYIDDNFSIPMLIGLCLTLL